jgi:hypothetical protein
LSRIVISDAAATYAAVAFIAFADAAAAAAAAATAAFPASLSLLERFKCLLADSESASRVGDWLEETEEMGSCDADRDRGMALKSGAGTSRAAGGEG